MQLSPDILRTFVAAARTLNFTHAARQMHLTQSAVSMQLKKLEQQAGVQLFTRKGRGLVPTEAGEAFTEYARQIITLNDLTPKGFGLLVHPRQVFFPGRAIHHAA